MSYQPTYSRSTCLKNTDVEFTNIILHVKRALSFYNKKEQEVKKREIYKRVPGPPQCDKCGSGKWTNKVYSTLLDFWIYLMKEVQSRLNTVLISVKDRGKNWWQIGCESQMSLCPCMEPILQYWHNWLRWLTTHLRPNKTVPSSDPSSRHGIMSCVKNWLSWSNPMTPPIEYKNVLKSKDHESGQLTSMVFVAL